MQIEVINQTKEKIDEKDLLKLCKYAVKKLKVKKLKKPARVGLPSSSFLKASVNF